MLFSIFAGKRLFAAAVADLSGRDFLLYSHPLRTEQHDSQWLNGEKLMADVLK